MSDSRAAILAIGNELLSGKVKDSNASFLVDELRALGVPLGAIITCPDDVGEIVHYLRDVKSRFEIVFTSGGVGPTHDDVTMQAVAEAFDRPLERHGPLADGLLRFYRREAGGAAGDGEVDPGVLRMADLPRGAELIFESAPTFPVVRVENVFVLPGEPTFFRAKFLAIRERFRQSPFHLQKVYLTVGEERLITPLRDAERLFPGVAVGSYPRYDTGDYKVLVTLESKDPSLVERAARALLDAIPKGSVLRAE